MRLRLLYGLLFAGGLLADVGSLIPSNKQAPDPTVLSMDEMAIDIHIDGSNARVLMRQIFSSHVPAISEGNYVFALPGGGPERGSPADVAILGAGIWVIEELDLRSIEPGEYELCCLPLKLQGADGAPARALLRSL